MKRQRTKEEEFGVAKKYGTQHGKKSVNGDLVLLNGKTEEILEHDKPYPLLNYLRTVHISKGTPARKLKIKSMKSL